MAERRMFAKTIIDSDTFLDMPLSTQALYFHLSMRADDEGFINNPKKILRMIGASEDDLKVLLAKNFLLRFVSGVIVIKHWRIHNYIQKDRFKPTLYETEKKMLTATTQGYEISGSIPCIQDAYTVDTECIQSVYTDKNSIDKDSIDKDSIDDKEQAKPAARTPKHTYGDFRNVKLTDVEYSKLADKYGIDKVAEAISFLDEYIEEKGYKSKSHYLSMIRWVFKAVQERKPKPKGGDIYAGIREWNNGNTVDAVSSSVEDSVSAGGIPSDW